MIFGTNLNIVLVLTFPAAILVFTFFQIFLSKHQDDQKTRYFSSRSMKGRRISLLISVIIYITLVIPLFLQRFQVRKFCLMNPGEIICKPHAQICFTDKIPRSFDYNGLENKFCSFIFPPGYSIHIENFNIDDPGPDNIVLLESEKFDEEKLGYHSKVEWRNRIQKYWKMLPNSHQLSNKHIRRDNIQCVKSLKVMLFFLVFYFL